MADERTFRIALLVIFFVTFPIGVYHRLQAHTPEPLDRRQEGFFILLTLRPVGLALLVSVVAYMVNPAYMAWSSLPLPVWLRWTGVVVCALGGALLLWTFRRLGKNLTDTVVTRREHTLVTHGPYRWIRHPFYDSVGMFAIGTSLVAANWLMGAAGVVLFILFAIRTRIEEEKLLARFGDSYRAYKDRTGRFLPRIAGSSGRARPPSRL